MIGGRHWSPFARAVGTASSLGAARGGLEGLERPRLWVPSHARSSPPPANADRSRQLHWRAIAGNDDIHGWITAIESERMAGRTLGLLLLVAVVGCDVPPSHRDLALATTTSVAHSGLLDVLLAAFQRQHGVTVHSHLVGSGLALSMMAKRDADVVITHAPEAEAEALNQHSAWRYRKVMFNDFVLVGPAHDPAGASHAESAEVAMRRIAASHSWCGHKVWRARRRTQALAEATQTR